MLPEYNRGVSMYLREWLASSTNRGRFWPLLLTYAHTYIAFREETPHSLKLTVCAAACMCKSVRLCVCVCVMPGPWLDI
jgi:hypothetical protein